MVQPYLASALNYYHHYHHQKLFILSCPGDSACHTLTDLALHLKMTVVDFFARE